MIYYFKDKPYSILHQTKIKLSGLISLFESKGMSMDGIAALEDFLYLDWVDGVIYKCLYVNLDGMIWAREKNQFFELFKPENA